MGRKIKGFGRCPSCNKKLRRTAERCTECGRLFKVYKNRYPNLSDESINKMVLNHHSSHVTGSYNGGSKPKFLKVVNVIG